MFIQNRILREIKKQVKENFSTEISYPSSCSSIEDIIDFHKYLTLLPTSEASVESLLELTQDLISLLKGNEESFISLTAKDASNLMVAKSIIPKFSLFDVDYAVQEVISFLKDNGPSYIVGGAIRDFILSRSPNNYNFVTNSPADTYTEYLLKNGFSLIKEDPVCLNLKFEKDGHIFEIQHIDQAVDYLYEDALLRDFTMNALYYSLSDEVLIDPTGYGLDDILNLKLRFVGLAEDRIEEDPSRVYRFYRFLSDGFSPKNIQLKIVRDLFEKKYSLISSKIALSEIEKIVFKPSTDIN